MGLRRNVIALNLPLVVAKLILFVRLVIQKMTNNTWFPNPVPTLAQISKDVDDLETAEAKARDGGKGTRAARDLAVDVVVEDMVLLGGYIRKVCNDNPGQTDLIIDSSGFSRRKFTKRDKAELAAQLGSAPATIRLDAKARARGSLYEWQWSSDGGRTWVTLGITDGANTTFTGVTAGTTYSFRFRTTRKGAVSDWSQTVTFTVH
jgi:hypothetical protein